MYRGYIGSIITYTSATNTGSVMEADWQQLKRRTQLFIWLIHYTIPSTVCNVGNVICAVGNSTNCLLVNTELQSMFGMFGTRGWKHLAALVKQRHAQIRTDEDHVLFLLYCLQHILSLNHLFWPSLNICLIWKSFGNWVLHCCRVIIYGLYGDGPERLGAHDSWRGEGIMQRFSLHLEKLGLCGILLFAALMPVGTMRRTATSKASVCILMTGQVIKKKRGCD